MIVGFLRIVTGALIIGTGIMGVLYLKGKDSCPHQEIKANLRPIDGLVRNQIAIDELTGADLANWIKAQGADSDHEYLVAYATDRIMALQGYEPLDQLSRGKYLVLSAVRCNTGIVDWTKLINFARLSPTLRQQLDDSNGNIVIRP